VEVGRHAVERVEERVGDDHRVERLLRQPDDDANGQPELGVQRSFQGGLELRLVAGLRVEHTLPLRRWVRTSACPTPSATRLRSAIGNLVVTPDVDPRGNAT
jgi:hypothetical protein